MQEIDSIETMREMRNQVASEIASDLDMLIDTFKRVLAIDGSDGEAALGAGHMHDELRFGLVRLFVI